MGIRIHQLWAWGGGLLMVILPFQNCSNVAFKSMSSSRDMAQIASVKAQPLNGDPLPASPKPPSTTPPPSGPCGGMDLSQGAMISGTITDASNGQPVEGIRVAVAYTIMSDAAIGVTDSQGRYVLCVLPGLAQEAQSGQLSSLFIHADTMVVYRDGVWVTPSIAYQNFGAQPDWKMVPFSHIYPGAQSTYDIQLQRTH